MKDCTRDNADAHACKWFAPGDKCILTGECLFEARPGATQGALSVQVAGDHYKSMAIQPVEFVHKNGIGYIEGSVIKYVSRWRKKNGVEDLRKARHFLDLLIEMEETTA